MGKETPKQQVVSYHMSLHFGICNGPAELIRVRMGDKDLWSGNVDELVVIGIDLDELYGGIKSEGGAVGALHYYPGLVDQKMSTFMALKYQRTPDTMTGYRGIATFALTETVSNASDISNASRIIGPALGYAERPGFYYSANSPYLRTIDAKVKRIPDGPGDWQRSLAAIPHVKFGVISPMALYIVMTQSYTVDDDSFDNARVAVCAAIDKIIDFKTRSPDSRFAFGITMSGSLFFAVRPPHIEYLDATVEQLTAAKTWITDFVRTGSASSYKWSFANMEDFFVATLPHGDDEDVFTRRTVIMMDTSQSTVQPSLDLGIDNYPDVQTKTDGRFNTADDTDVDTYYVVYDFFTNPPELEVAESFANQPVGPTVSEGDQAGLTEAVLDCIRPKTKEPDMNPAHIVYESLTNSEWGMGAPTTMLYVPDFAAAAQTLYNEEFGLSLMWSQQTTIEAFIQEVIDHIQATLYVDPNDGLIHFKLIRNDYDPGSLLTLDKNNAKIVSFQRKLVSETINEVVVSWTNPDNEQSETVTAQDLANISIQGGIVSDSRNYYGVRTKELATMLAWRDIAASSSPLVSCEIEADRRAWRFVPGGVVKLSWPEYGITEMILRIGQIDYGKPGEPRIKLSCMEDVFGSDLVQYTVADKTEWIQPSTVPAVAPFTSLFTLNYLFTQAFIDSSIYSGAAYPEGFIGALASSTAIDGYDFELMSYNGAAYENVGSKSITSRGTLATALVAEVSTDIDFTALNRSRGAGPVVGGFVIIGTDEATQEIAYIASVTGATMGINRGSLDTIPRDWPVGTPLWFVTETSEIGDRTVRADTETATVKVLPRTNKGLLALADAPALTYTVNDRAWRPTRPAKVTVAGQTFGTVDIEGIDPVTVTWAERNRITENSVFLPWNATTVAGEAGQTTKITLMKLDGTVLYTFDGLTGTSHDISAAAFTESQTRVRVESERDDFTSWQGHEIIVISGVGYYGYSYGFDYGGREPPPPGTPVFFATIYPDNPDAESGITGWSSLTTGSNFVAVSSLDAIETSGSTPYAGTHSFYHGVNTLSVVSTDITVADLDSGIQTQIAAGTIIAKLKYALLTDEDGFDRGSADLFFYDDSDEWIGGCMFDLHTSDNVWTLIEEGPIEVPRETARITVQLRAVRDGDDIKLNVYQDAISIDLFKYDTPQEHYLEFSASGDDTNVFELHAPVSDTLDPFSFLTGTSSPSGNGWGVDTAFRWKTGSPANRSASTPFRFIEGVSSSDIDNGLTSFVLHWRQLNADNLGSRTVGHVRIDFFTALGVPVASYSTSDETITRNGAGDKKIEVPIIPATVRKYTISIYGTRIAGTTLVAVNAYFMYMNAYSKKNA